MSTKEVVLKSVIKLLEQWFHSGVTYTKGKSMLFGTPTYTNQPGQLENELIVTHGRIAFIVLREKGFSIGLWPELLILSPAHDKHEVTEAPIMPAIFGRPYLSISDRLIYEAEGMPPDKRAREVASRWYKATYGNWAKLIDEKAKESNLTGDTASNGNGVEKGTIKALLAKLGYDVYDLLQLYLDAQGFTYFDISNFPEDFGVKKSPEAVRKSIKPQSAVTQI
ncbi:hypothetical protein ACFLS8_01200 [Chloroflexota bacterium]